MREILVICVLSCVVLNSVHSATFYFRNGREAVIPMGNEIIPEEIYAELRKEPETIAIEEEEMPMVVKEEIIVPVETLRIVQPVVEVMEPVAVVSEKEISEPEQLMKTIATEVMKVEKEMIAKPMEHIETMIKEVEPVMKYNEKLMEPVKKAEEKPMETEKMMEMSSVNKDEPEKHVEIMEETVVPEIMPNMQMNDKIIPVLMIVEEKEEQKMPVEESLEAIKTTAVENGAVPITPAEKVLPSNDDALRQNDNIDRDEVTTTRPNIIQQAQQTLTQIINNNPLTNAINSIRQPAPTPVVQSDEVPTVVPADVTPTRPNLIQQFQTGVQNIQHQIQSVFNPSLANTAGAETPVDSETPPRPGFIQQIQNAVGQVFNRPSDGASVNSPIQGFVSGIQSNLQGIFRPQSDATVVAGAAATSNHATMADVQVIDGLPVVNEKVEIVDDKVENV